VFPPAAARCRAVLRRGHSETAERLSVCGS